MDVTHAERIGVDMLTCVKECIEKAQRGICELPSWYGSSGPRYRHYDTFAARFNDVEQALRVRFKSNQASETKLTFLCNKESKAACVSLFSIHLFPERLSWNPGKEHGVSL